MSFKTIPREQAPKKIDRKELVRIREIVLDHLNKIATSHACLGEHEQCLVVEKYPKYILNSLRKWYLKHGYPNTCMRKGKLYICE